MLAALTASDAAATARIAEAPLQPDADPQAVTRPIDRSPTPTSVLPEVLPDPTPPEPMPSEPVPPVPAPHPAVRLLWKVAAIAAGLLVISVLAVVLLVGNGSHRTPAADHHASTVSSSQTSSSSAVDQALDRLDELVKP
jgi:hypothetical protein